MSNLDAYIFVLQTAAEQKNIVPEIKARRAWFEVQTLTPHGRPRKPVRSKKDPEKERLWEVSVKLGDRQKTVRAPKFEDALKQINADLLPLD